MHAAVQDEVREEKYTLLAENAGIWESVRIAHVVSFHVRVHLCPNMRTWDGRKTLPT
jgi:hypothetical protein